MHLSCAFWHLKTAFRLPGRWVAPAKLGFSVLSSNLKPKNSPTIICLFFKFWVLLSPQFPTVLSLHAISISCFYTINLLKLLPFLCGAFALISCLTYWNSELQPPLVLVLGLWYLLFVIVTWHFYTLKWAKLVFFYFVPPPFGKQLCGENINQTLAKSSYALRFLFPENLANLFGVHLHFLFL